MTRFIAVVGGKHSGKTTVIQQLLLILKSRGYRVATIKEMPNISSIDKQSENHDTWKHSEAGADIVVASPQDETVLFIKRKLSINEIAFFLQSEDYVLLEGFEKERVLPKIIAAKTVDEAASFSNGLTIAISGLLAESPVEMEKVSKLQIPVFNAKLQTETLVDLVEQKTFPLLPNLIDCAKCRPLSECGYPSCYEYAKAIISGKSKTRCCPLDLKENFVIKINGNRLPLKDFPQAIIQNILMGLVSSLHGAKDIKTLKIEINSHKSVDTR